jgi:general secretion pathway protein D
VPGPGSTNAPVQPAEVADIAVRFVNASIEQVLEFYADLTGKTVLRSPMVQPTMQIAVKSQTLLTRSEARQVLDTVLALNNFTVVPMGEKFVTVVPAVQALQEGAVFSIGDGARLPEAAQYVTQIIHMTNALPSEVIPVLQPFAKMPNGLVPIDSNSILVIRDYAANVKRMLEIIQKVDVHVDPDYKLEVIPIKYGKVEDIYNVMSGLVGSGVGAAPGAARTGAAARAGRGAGAMSRRSGLRQPGQLGQAGVQPGQPSPTTAQSAFQDRLRQIVARAAGGESQILGDARIIPDDRANSLVVYANKQDLIMITNIVAKLDVMLAQVLIEAVIIDVSLNSGWTLGVSAMQNPRTSGKFTGAGGMKEGPEFLSGLTNSLASSLSGGFTYFGRWAGDLDLAVAALASDSSASVLQRPRIQTSHAVPASFFSGSTVPYITSTYYGGGYGGYGYSPSASYSQLSVGIGLDVTPYITPDGLVVMEVSQTIDELAGTTKIGNDEVPNTTSRTANSTISVKDGETIILGGFIRTSKSKSKSGVPLLKDIPLLGALFRSSTDNSERRELIVMMRPTVLPSPQDAALAASYEKERLPGVQRAEREFEEVEKKTLKKTARKLGKKLP